MRESGITHVQRCQGMVGSLKISSETFRPSAARRLEVSSGLSVVKQMWCTPSPCFASRRPSGVSVAGCMSWISAPPAETNVAQRIWSPPPSNSS